MSFGEEMTRQCRLRASIQAFRSPAASVDRRPEFGSLYHKEGRGVFANRRFIIFFIRSENTKNTGTEIKGWPVNPVGLPPEFMFSLVYREI